MLFEESGESRSQDGDLLHAYNFVRIHKTLRVSPAMKGWRHEEALENVGLSEGT
jgi:hypothetical protein